MEINIWQILFQIFNFGLVMFLLNKVLYKPVMKMLDDRAKKINEGMSQAEKNLKAGEELEKMKKLELTKARKEAAAIMSKAEADARVKADTLIGEAKKKAKDEAAKLLDNANKEIESNHAKLEKKAVELALAMTKATLANSLSSKDVETITTGMLKAIK